MASNPSRWPESPQLPQIFSNISGMVEHFYQLAEWRTTLLQWLRFPLFLEGYGSRELAADPDDPDAGTHVIWQSDGTGTGDDGDIIMKITDSGGTTKTTTIVDYSTV